MLLQRDMDLLLSIAPKHKSQWPSRNRPRLFWGPAPIISNKYWSKSMEAAGYSSRTIMHGVYTSINCKNDFDEYLSGYSLKNPLKYQGSYCNEFAILENLLERFDVFHLPFTGCIIGEKGLIEFETEVFKRANKKIIILPYGSDSYAYDKVGNLSLRQALLMSYPESGRIAGDIKERIRHYSTNADAVVPGFMCELFPFWTVMTCSPFVIDTSIWQDAKTNALKKENICVNILHTPNHRGFKGTEFLVAACKRLQHDGYHVNLILLEKKQNEEVRHIMQNKADILVEQLIFDGYALSAIEGMASGLPVLSNLSNANLATLMRRYSFLDECPIISTSPENIYNNLKILIENPNLRRELGHAGRKYVEKYHSFATAQYMFGKIYDQFNGGEIDCMTLFHPLLGEYPKRLPKIKHPLVNNNIVL